MISPRSLRVAQLLVFRNERDERRVEQRGEEPLRQLGIILAAPRIVQRPNQALVLEKHVRGQGELPRLRRRFLVAGGIGVGLWPLAGGVVVIIRMVCVGPHLGILARSPDTGLLARSTGRA